MIRRILLNANRLPPGISVTSDRTIRERDIRSLRRQMAQHNAAHPERPLTIKFLNNVLTLVDRAASHGQLSAVANRQGRGHSSVTSVFATATGVSRVPPVQPPPSSVNGIFQLAVNRGGAISHRPTMVRQSSPNASLTAAATAKPRPPSFNGDVNHHNSHLGGHFGSRHDNYHEDTNQDAIQVIARRDLSHYTIRMLDRLIISFIFYDPVRINSLSTQI